MTDFDLVAVTLVALFDLWQGFLGFLPKLIAALVVFLVGWFIGGGFGKLVSEFLRRLRFNQIFERSIWREAFERAELKVDAAGFIGALIKWILVIVFLSVAAEILSLVAFVGFLTKVLSYLPNAAVAALIFVVTVVIADIAEKVVKVGVESTRVGYGHFAGSIVKWSIWVFALMAILRQLLIVPQMIDTLFNAIVYGVVALFVISGGIAFGLGGKDMATEILHDLRKKMKK
jgi:hypothetical protein